MITLSIILALSFAVISLTLFVLAAIYWFPLWRNKRAGIAHCLFLTNALLAMISLVRLIQVGSFIVNGEGGKNPFSLIVCFIMLCVAVVQFALSKGYFTVQE